MHGLAHLPVGLGCALRESFLFPGGRSSLEDPFLSALGMPVREGGRIPALLPVRLGGRSRGLGLRSRLSTLEAALRVFAGSVRLLLRGDLTVGLMRRKVGGTLCVGLMGEVGERGEEVESEDVGSVPEVGALREGERGS